MAISNKKRKYIQRNYPAKSPEVLAKELDLSTREVKIVIREAGLDKKAGNGASSVAVGLPWKELGLALLAVVVVSGIVYGAYRTITLPSLTKLRSTASQMNVLLITVDTCRADHLGCYGRTGARTPTMDGLARSGVRFSRAISHVPVTLPSHVSIMTGMLPPAHGVEDNGTFRLPQQARTLAEAFKDKGYATAAVVSSFVLNSQFGLDQGFDDYYDQMSLNVSSSATGFDEIPATDVTEQAMSWIRDHSNAPWFFWAHYFDPHASYNPPAGFQKGVPGLYDGEIAFVDYNIGQLMDYLETLGLKDRTLVVLTSDHGEGLGQHGESTHMVFIYDATMHVPLIVSQPKVLPRGIVLDQPVGLVDLMPTLLDAWGLETGSAMQGRSLLPLIFGDEGFAEEPIYLESRAALHQYGWSMLQGIITEDYKYIRAPKPELYNLDADPQELTNLIDAQKGRAAAMSKQLDQLVEQASESSLEGEAWVDMDPETERRLGSLGYVWTRAASASSEGITGQDPKDMIGTMNMMNRSAQLMSEGRFADSISLIEQVIKKSPNNKRALNRLGQLYARLASTDPQLKSERIEMAVVYLRRSIEVDPNFFDAYHNLGQVLVVGGKPGQALELMQGLLEKEPRDAKANNILGHAYFELQDYDKAIKYFVKSIEIYPHADEPHGNLGATYARLGRYEDARQQFSLAAHLNPGQTKYKDMLNKANKQLNSK